MSILDLRSAVHAWVVAASGLADVQVIWAEQKGDVPSGTYITLFMPGTRSIGRDAESTINNPLVLTGGVPHPIDSVDFANDILVTHPGHTHYETGDGPVRLTTTGTLPTGLALNTDYWIVDLGAGNIQLALSLADAVAAVPMVVSFSDAGTGTHSIESTASTYRVGENIYNVVSGPRTIDLEIRCYADDSETPAQAVYLLERVKSRADLPTIATALLAAELSILSFSSISSVSAVINTTVLEPRAMLDVTLSIMSVESELGDFIETVVTTEDPEIVL